MIIYLKNKHTLSVDQFDFECCVGKNGISKKKIEGDKKTPKGIFNLGPLFYRKDRIQNIHSRINHVMIKKNMGWCDDIGKPKYYNKLIKVKKNVKHEKLYRKDSKYDLLIPIKYNYKKIIIGKGSCIFIHLTENLNPTEGCIALKKKDFLIMLKLIDKKTRIKIS